MTAAATTIVTEVIGEGSSDFFAGEDERVANSDADEPQREHRRQPNDQIHRSLLPPGTNLQRPCGSGRQIASRTFAPLPMTSSAASLWLEGPAYIWARRHRRDPDKGSIPIAMRAYKGAIKDARGGRGFPPPHPDPGGLAGPRRPGSQLC